MAWSPDGRYIAAGGEDDLVSIYGMAERGVVVWGEGHSSWVMQVAFDPWYAFCMILTHHDGGKAKEKKENTMPLGVVYREAQGGPKLPLTEPV